MAVSTKNRKNRRSKSQTSTRPKKPFIGKPSGQIQSRVQLVGPQHFGVISVDCAKHLSKNNIRFQIRTIEKIVVWSKAAADASELTEMHTRQWKQLNELRLMLSRQVFGVEAELAGFLAKTPYVLLLSVTGINVVSAARLAGEAGPIKHYASARAINGRAGLYPSRYQSDEVDHADGSLARQANRFSPSSISSDNNCL